MALGTADRLEALYGLTSDALKLDTAAFNRRVALWEALAGEQDSADPAQKAAQVQVLALRAWQTSLLGEADKFRAEGDITVEKDILGRVALVSGWLMAAEAAAGGGSGTGLSSPAPIMGDWGVDRG